MPSPEVELSVLMPVFNERGTIEQAIAAVLEAGPAESYEVIVVDDGSRDGTSELLRGCAWAFLALSTEIALALLAASGPMSESSLEPLEQFRSPQFVEELKSSGLPPEKVAEWTDQVATLREALAVVFPAVYIIGGGLVVLVNGPVGVVVRSGGRETARYDRF